MKLPPFIGMTFNQFLLGICPWLCSGGHPLQHSCTCPHLTTQSPLMPLPFPRFHPCINTIRPVKKGTTTRSPPLLFLIDYAEQPSLHPPLMSLNSTGAGSMPTDPPPSFLLPPSDLIGFPSTYTSLSFTSCKATVNNNQTKREEDDPFAIHKFILANNRFIRSFVQD